jgi:AcrR family transcriptional regulator
LRSLPGLIRFRFDAERLRETVVGDEKRREPTALLDAAEDLIRSAGADGWTLDELARRVGLGVDEVRREFEDEWEAFCLVMRRDEDRFGRSVSETLPEGAAGKIMAVLEACVPDYDWTFWIELWSLALRDERALKLRSELEDSFREGLEAIVREGIEEGEFNVAEPRAVAITISTLIDALAMQATLGDTTVRPNYMLDASVTVCGCLLGTKLSLPSLEGPRNV